jgi:hypothetical protein
MAMGNFHRSTSFSGLQALDLRREIPVRDGRQNVKEGVEEPCHVDMLLKWQTIRRRETCVLTGQLV